MKKKKIVLIAACAIIVCATIITFILVVLMGKGPAAYSTTTLPESTPEKASVFPSVSKIPYKIAVSTDFVRELAYMFARGRSSKATVIIGPGVDPLLYKPTPEDEKSILETDLFLYVGLGLEPGLEQLIAKFKDKVRCEAITSILKPSELLQSGEYPSGYDPHVWWAPDLWEKILLNMVRILSEVDPEAEFDYGTTYQRYGESVSLLNHRYMEIWSSYIPKERRVLVTIHPAFAYFGRLYDFTVKSIYDPFESSYSQDTINELADFIVKNKVLAIFPELGFSRKPIEDLKAAVDKRGYKVKIGNELFSYSLAQDMNAREYLYLNAGRKLMQNIYEVLKTKESMEMPK